MLGKASSNSDVDSFNSELTKALVSANIPLSKIEHECFKMFLEKHTKHKMPTRKTLSNMMENESKEVLGMVKTKLAGKSIFISLDETTDSMGRPMCAVLAGPLDGEFLGRPFLIDLIDLGSTNNQTVQQCVNTALFKLLGDELNYDKVRLFLMDGAAYCIKAGKSLTALYPNLIHCLCLAHGMNRVAELVRYNFPKVDLLIAEVKKIFIKCAHRRADFATTCQVPLPPKPVLTR